MKRMMISVHSIDNAYFAWSVVVTVYPAERNADRESSYPHYTTVLNFADIEFSMTLKDISRFERLNDVSINVYDTENKQVLPLQLITDKKEKHVNMQVPRDDDVGHFAWIKICSVRSQIRDKKKKFFCDR